MPASPLLMRMFHSGIRESRGERTLHTGWRLVPVQGSHKVFFADSPGLYSTPVCRSPVNAVRYRQPTRDNHKQDVSLGSHSALEIRDTATLEAC